MFININATDITVINGVRISSCEYIVPLKLECSEELTTRDTESDYGTRNVNRFIGQQKSIAKQQ